METELLLPHHPWSLPLSARSPREYESLLPLSPSTTSLLLLLMRSRIVSRKGIQGHGRREELLLVQDAMEGSPFLFCLFNFSVSLPDLDTLKTLFCAGAALMRRNCCCRTSSSHPLPPHVVSSYAYVDNQELMFNWLLHNLSHCMHERSHIFSCHLYTLLLDSEKISIVCMNMLFFRQSISYHAYILSYII
jgi:hypothetical protein